VGELPGRDARDHRSRCDVPGHDGAWGYHRAVSEAAAVKHDCVGAQPAVGADAFG